jgi:hypothetical protein
MRISECGIADTELSANSFFHFFHSAFAIPHSAFECVADAIPGVYSGAQGKQDPGGPGRRNT